MPEWSLGQMPDQSLLLLEVFECVLAYVQLLFKSKRLWVWRIVPCINVVPPQLNNLQIVQQLLIAAEIDQHETMVQTMVTVWFTCMFLTLVFS